MDALTDILITHSDQGICPKVILTDISDQQHCPYKSYILTNKLIWTNFDLTDDSDKYEQCMCCKRFIDTERDVNMYTVLNLVVGRAPSSDCDHVLQRANGV